MRCSKHLPITLLMSLGLLLSQACSPLPKDWPIPELTLPAGAEPAAIPRNARTLREKLNHVGKIEDRLPLAPKWEIAFNNKKMTWDAMVSAVEGQLTPLGYTQWTPPDPQNTDGHVLALGGASKWAEVMRIYESADKKTVVNFINTGTMTSSGDSIDVEGSYVLAIFNRP